MCKTAPGKSGQIDGTPWACSCICPASLTVEEEIQLLEDHGRYIRNQAEIIEKKIAALKSAKGP